MYLYTFLNDEPDEIVWDIRNKVRKKKIKLSEKIENTNSYLCDYLTIEKANRFTAISFRLDNITLKYFIIFLDKAWVSRLG